MGGKHTEFFSPPNLLPITAVPWNHFTDPLWYTQQIVTMGVGVIEGEKMTGCLKMRERERTEEREE